MDVTEEELIRKAQAGDQDAFTRLILRQEAVLSRVALSALRQPEDAADAVQEAVLRAWKHLPGLRHPQYFRTWLVRILLRECATLRKSREKHSHTEWEEALDHAAPLSAPETALDVHAALEALKREDRMILALYYFDDFSVREIARALGVSQSAAKQRLHRAREKFRAIYEGREQKL